MRQPAINDTHVILRTTSPDGPIGVLKAVSKAYAAGALIDWAQIDPQGKYPELKPLAMDRVLTVRAAIVEDADLAASTLMGLRANREMSQSLTEEWQSLGYRAKNGQPEDVRGPVARIGFVKFVFGGAPSSAAGKSLMGNYVEMMHQTEHELAAQPPRFFAA